MVHRLILAKWLKGKSNLPPVQEAIFSDDQLQSLNQQGYNCYFLPNYPSDYDGTKIVDGPDIDTFEYVYADMDLKEKKWESKEAFLEFVHAQTLIPSCIVDSGNGIHVYWKTQGLDAMSFLRLQRRICRAYSSDEAVAKIYQLMRIPGTLNVKDENNFKPCEILFTSENVYDVDTLNQTLPRISMQDEAYCKAHFDKTYKLNQTEVKDLGLMPKKFAELCKKSPEAKQLFTGTDHDRSKGDYRLGHLLFANNYTRDEALKVLYNTTKAAERSEIHRFNYANDIVQKIWGFENEALPDEPTSEAAPDEEDEMLSSSVKDILNGVNAAVEGKRFPCNEYVDATAAGFRLGQVLGLIGGSGSGKTMFALNYFYWFAEANPEYDHLFVSLEQPRKEIADRWKKVAGENTRLHEKVHILDNYNKDGTNRNLSLPEIQDYIFKLEEKIGRKIGCVVIDHIGILNTGGNGEDTENRGLMKLCKAMKAFAIATNTFLVMQSQTSREKAGEGDVELNKDAAYGTSKFEWYCDFLVTTWQPLKRMYDRNPEMTVTCFKYCKIRDKNIMLDKIKEGIVYYLMFNPETERLRALREDEEQQYDFIAKQASVIRNKDRKRDVAPIRKMDWVRESKIS